MILDVAAGLAERHEREPTAPLFVIDDDPTGAQGQANVPLLLAWDAELIAAALREGPRALHLLTNSRALDAEAGPTRPSATRSRPRGAAPIRGSCCAATARFAPICCPSTRRCATSSGPGAAPAPAARPGAPGRRPHHPGRPPPARSATASGCRSTRPSSRATATSPTRLSPARVGQERSGGYFRGRRRDRDRSRTRSAPRKAPTRVRRRALRAAARSGPPSSYPTPSRSRTSGDRRRAGQARSGAPPIVVRCAPTFASVLSGAGATDVVAAARRSAAACSSSSVRTCR